MQDILVETGEEPFHIQPHKGMGIAAVIYERRGEITEEPLQNFIKS